jgi:hypothetical protein
MQSPYNYLSPEKSTVSKLVAEEESTSLSEETETTSGISDNEKDQQEMTLSQEEQLLLEQHLDTQPIPPTETSTQPNSMEGTLALNEILEENETLLAEVNRLRNHFARARTAYAELLAERPTNQTHSESAALFDEEEVIPTPTAYSSISHPTGMKHTVWIANAA